LFSIRGACGATEEWDQSSGLQERCLQLRTSGAAPIRSAEIANLAGISKVVGNCKDYGIVEVGRELWRSSAQPGPPRAGCPGGF